MKMKYVWDEWCGGSAPPEGDLVEATLRSGICYPFDSNGYCKLFLDWKHTGAGTDIISYCITVPDDGEEL